MNAVAHPDSRVHRGHCRDCFVINFERRQAHNRAISATHWAVKLAIERGELVPQPCERCGKGIYETLPGGYTHRLVNAHHEDYSKPLDVVWLCPACHAKRHQEIKAESK